MNAQQPFAYPRNSAGQIASNFLLAEDCARPRFDCDIATLTHRSPLPTVAIIGGGLLGVSTAYHLAQLNREQGKRFRVILLERDFIASGPSGKAAGHICGLQVSDDKVIALCGEALGLRLVAHAHAAADYVRELATELGDAIDLRDGYVGLGADGAQVTSRGTDAFSIAPYPLALGLAFTAAALGATVCQHCPVIGIAPTGDGYTLNTAHGAIQADRVIACAGTRMAFDIDLLAPLRSLTNELNVATIITEPLSPAVLETLFPHAPGERLAFADDCFDVAYGTIDRDERIQFGACATAWGTPAPSAIARRLARLLPRLDPLVRERTGKPLRWQSLVPLERLSFTFDNLPNVGCLPGQPGVFYANGLGGHGIALGIWIGKGLAERVWSDDVEPGEPSIFADFAAVTHRKLPTPQPWRALASMIGLVLSRWGLL